MADILLNRAIKIIPDDWEQVKIGEIGTTYGGLTNKSKKDFGEGKPFIPFMNIMNNAKIDMDDFEYVNIEEDENQNRAIKGDLFFNTSSETPEEVGMCSLLYNDISELYLNSFCFGYRLKNQDSLNPLFVSYFFRSDFGRRVIFPLAQGMTRYNLSKRYFLQLEIPKPRLEEQNKIIDILSIVDESIEKTAAIIEETRQLKKGLMQKLFTEGIGHTRFKDTKIGKIPEEWEIIRFGDIVRTKQLGTTNRGLGEKNIPLVKMGNLQKGKVLMDDIEMVEFSDELSSLILVNNDFLFNTRNSPELVGKVSSYRGKKKAVFDNNILRIKFIENVNSLFMGYLFNEPSFVGRLKRIVSGTTSVAAIYWKDLIKLLVPLVPIQEQSQITQIISEVDAKIEKEEATKTELEQLKKGLMQVLLTGKVRVKA